MMTWPPLITPAAYWWAAEARQEPQPSLAECPVSDPQTGQRLVCGHRWSPACRLCADSRPLCPSAPVAASTRRERRDERRLPSRNACEKPPPRVGKDLLRVWPG